MARYVNFFALCSLGSYEVILTIEKYFKGRRIQKNVLLTCVPVGVIG